MKVTEVFEETYDRYQETLTQAEYDVRLKKHVEMGLPGVPSWKRYSQITNVGGSRSSKTYTILQILKLVMQTRKDVDIKVWRKTKVECRSICRKDFRKIVKDDPINRKNFKEHIQDGTFLYKPTGSMITFTGADDEGVVLGAGQTISFFNEVNHISERVYNQVCQRTEETVFVDYNPAEGFYMENYRNDPDTIFIHSTFMDNYFCPINAANKLLSYEPWESGSYEVVGAEVWYNGKPISATNQPPVNKANFKKKTIDEYMWMVYGLGLGAEAPNKIYSGWGRISLEKFKTLEYTSYFGLDFGTSKPTAMVEVKYDGNGAFYIRERVYEPMSDINESMTDRLKTLVPDLKVGSDLVVCDSAKEEYIKTMKRAGHFAVGAIKGNNSVEPGIQTVKGFKIYVVPYGNENSKEDNIRAEESVYQWEVDRNGNRTDKPLKKDDHLMDAIRYVITYLVKYLDIEI